MRAGWMLAAGMLAGCSDPSPPEAVTLNDHGVPTTPVALRTPNATGPGTALGLTYLQLEDAALVDAGGATLGEVKRIEADRAGTIHGLVIELPDRRLVAIDLAGLTLAHQGQRWNLRTPMDAATLAARPAVAQ